MIDWLKIAGFAAIPIAAGLAVLVFLQWLNARDLRRDVTRLENENKAIRLMIEAPLIGYNARLGQCQATNRVLEARGDAQAKDIQKLAEDTAKLRADTGKLLLAAANTERVAKQGADRILAFPRPADPAVACASAARILKRGTP